MANQRDEKKKLKTLWLTPQEYKALRFLSDLAGMNHKDYLLKPITKHLEAQTKKKK